MIKKSYGNTARPATILFKEGLPVKGHCNCPVGPSGLCCHVLALLLFLKHFHETKEKILELTCTQQLQKWHRRSGKGSSIPMVPLMDIKVRSASRKSKKDLKVTAADPDNSYFKRNVSSIMSSLSKKLDKEKPVTEHVYDVLSKSKIGLKSSVGQHLNHLFKLNQLGDHQYIAKESFEKNFLGIDRKKEERIQSYIDNECVDNVQSVPDTNENINVTTSQDIALQNRRNVYENSSENYKITRDDINDKMLNTPTPTNKKDLKTIKLDISFLEAPVPAGLNYVNTTQNSAEWHKTRSKKITGSRISSLIGLQGSVKFSETWKTVRTGQKEKDISCFENIKRGIEFEKDGVKFFEEKSKCVTKSCGFFFHPDDNRFGASPDALGPNGILVEIKTRAKGCIGPLKNLISNEHYYVQCQLQMACTDAHSCVLVSYVPESKTGNFFMVQRNDTIIDILMEVCDAIWSNKVIETWSYTDTNEHKNLGKKLSARTLDFEALKPLRSFVNKSAKNIAKIDFVDQMDLELEQ